MILEELINITNKLYYNDSSSYNVVASKSKELLTIIYPNTNIKDINIKTINKYIDYLKKQGNKPATINSKLAYLSHILTYALHNELIEHKPYIPTFKIKASKDKYLNQQEIDSMLQWTIEHNQKQLHDIILIGLNTGLRINNILSIKSEDIQNNYLRVFHNKTNRPYSVPLNDTMKVILSEFVGFTMKYQEVYYIFNKMKQDLNLDSQITIHTLRHTFCSNLINKGVPITTIQKLANHKKIETTMRYAHLSNKELELAVNML